MERKCEAQHRICPDVASRPASDSCAGPAASGHQPAQPESGSPQVHYNLAEGRVQSRSRGGRLLVGNVPGLFDQRHVNTDLRQSGCKDLQIPRFNPAYLPVAEHQGSSRHTSQYVVEMNPGNTHRCLKFFDSTWLDQLDQLHFVRVGTQCETMAYDGTSHGRSATWQWENQARAVVPDIVDFPTDRISL